MVQTRFLASFSFLHVRLPALVSGPTIFSELAEGGEFAVSDLKQAILLSASNLGVGGITQTFTSPLQCNRPHWSHTRADAILRHTYYRGDLLL